MKQTAKLTSEDPRWGSEGRPCKANAIWQTLLHYSGPEIAKGLWVDIGCGSGGIAATLAPRVERMIGIDPEPWTRWADWMNENPNLRFIQGSYDTEPPLLEANTVDVVLCNQVYEHVPDPQRLISEIYRILKPGGYCYFAGPNLLFPIEPHVFWPFVHWLPRKTALAIMRFVGSKELLDANAAHYWKLRSWLTAYETHNALPAILSQPSIFNRAGLIWNVLARLPKWLLAKLTFASPGFVFVLRKHNHARDSITS